MIPTSLHPGFLCALHEFAKSQSDDPRLRGCGRKIRRGATSRSSATICYGCLFVCSTNTPFAVTMPSEPHGYTKFPAYAVFNRGCNLSAAARKVRRQGVSK